MAGRMWQECVCGCRIHEWGIAGNKYDEDEDVFRDRHIVLRKVVDHMVFCSRKCGLAEERRLRQVEHRRRRIAGLIFKRFGKVKFGFSGYIWADARSGYCKCDQAKMGEYPGSFNCKIPGLKYDITGCIWCGQYGVSKIDHDAFRALCKERGISLKE